MIPCTGHHVAGLLQVGHTAPRIYETPPHGSLSFIASPQASTPNVTYFCLEDGKPHRRQLRPQERSEARPSGGMPGSLQTLTTSISIVKYWLVYVLSFSALIRALKRVNPDMSAKSMVVQNSWCFPVGGGGRERKSVSEKST